MIGHYLLTLTPEQEDRVLTLPMRHFPGGKIEADPSARCFLMVVWAADEVHDLDYIAHRFGYVGDTSGDFATYVTARYDRLCGRFSVERVNAAIRNRILSNQLRRTLVKQPEAVHV